MATFESSLKPRLIYVFAISDKAHADCLKIGETTLDEDDGSLPVPNSDALNRAARHRIDQYTQTAGIAYQLLYTELTLYFAGGKVCSFNDKQVHSVLERSGIRRKVFDYVKGANEWYCCDLETVKRAIAAVKKGQTSLNPGDVSHEQNPIILRPEQVAAVEKTKKQFKRGNQMLWNAKMRFGKTLCALRVARDMELQRTIIITHRPVVDEGWFEDFGKIFYDRTDYHYGSRTKGESFASLERLAKKGDKYVYFASMQDMRGSEVVGGKFDKNNEVFSTTWDYLIVDEAHEGTETELGKAVLAELTKPTTKVLKLSGTPFNLLDDYKESEIFTWDYVMEQRAKAEWDLTHFGDPNPYESLPAINIYTYDLGTLLAEYSDDEHAFNFREFFRTRDEDGTFIHERDIDRFLHLLCSEKPDSLYPYSCDEFRRIFRHTLWVLPGVKAARALSAKLQAHPVFGAFTVVNVAGDGDEDEENRDALDMVNRAIGPDPDATYTITLSCGRLTTGVSIRPWTAVFMMAGSFSTSAANYMQTIFRVQTPFTHNGRMKQQCYAFDFAPDRTLRVLAEVAKVSAKVGKQTDEDRKILGDFLNFCPIISIEGSQMKPYDVNNMLGQLKRAQIEKVVQCGFEDGVLYNDELLKLTEVELRDFAGLKKIIGKTKAMPKPGDIDINKQGLTNEQYAEKEKIERKPRRERTPEDQARLDELKALGNQRREAIAILRGISIRMPLLLYGADIKDEDTELTIGNFANLVDDESWCEFMPAGVTKEVFERFSRYYDPDVFREAGKRIREMARAADRFTVEQRIERIAAIFNTFRNPDKETVLTPWRVVNMHMSDCLGGYCFMDDRFERTIDIPRYVDRGKVTRDVFRSESHILEINSKSGLYPLYVAYSIYRARVDEARAKYGEIGRSFALQLWDLTIAQNILVVCKTPMARSITRRTLAGFRDVSVNASYYPNLIENITQKPALVVNTLRDGRRYWHINQDDNMTIDAIIGNPPYQVMDGGNSASAKPVYHYFFLLAKSLHSNYVSMIMPARWYAGGKGLDDFRDTTLNDNHFVSIYDFANSADCFPTVNIAGGLLFFLWCKYHKGNCNIVNMDKTSIKSELNRPLNSFDILIRDNRSFPIICKVKSLSTEYLSEQAFSRNAFNLPSNFRGHTKRENGDYMLLSSNGKSFVHPKDVSDIDSELIRSYKVIITYAMSGGNKPSSEGNYQVISSLSILQPNEICTETFLVLSRFDEKEIAEGLISYAKTKFFRFMLLQSLSSIHITKDCFRFVPLQDFTRQWTDADLYKKYNLTEDEVAYIERTIKPMD